MSNKILALALLLSVGVTAQAETAPTFADIANANSALKLQELKNKLEEAKLRAAPVIGNAGASGLPPLPNLPLPPIVPSKRTESAGAADIAPDEKIQIVSIYGLGDKLSAELLYKGATHTVRAGSSSPVSGWSVDRVTPYAVTLVRANIKRTGKKVSAGEPTYREIHFSADLPAEEDTKTQKRKAAPPGFLTPSGY